MNKCYPEILALEEAEKAIAALRDEAAKRRSPGVFRLLVIGAGYRIEATSQYYPAWADTFLNGFVAGSRASAI